MSPSRSGRPADDPVSPDAPRRRFARWRGAAAELPPGTDGPDGPHGSGAHARVPAVAGPQGGAPTVIRSELRPVGPHFVIAPSTAGQDELSAAVGALRPVPDSIIVVAAAPDSAPVLRDRMADLGVIARSRGATSLVLAASGLAALAPNGRRPAEVVADRAGLPVVAPDGLVEITQDGNLKVIAPDGAPEGATWWHCAPGAAPRPVRETIGATAPIEPHHAAGPLLPTVPAVVPTAAAVPVVPAVPAVQAAPAGSRAPAVQVHRLPVGYWLTHPAVRPSAPRPDLTLAGAPPGTVVLVVGTPALPVLLPEDFADTVAALPLGSARLLVSAPWAAPAELATLTGALSARLARPVNAAIGLPVIGPGGPTSYVLDTHGRACWEPYLLRLAAAPGLGTVPSGWRNGGASWHTAGPAVFDAFPYWALEAVPAGLWLRPEPPHILTPRFRRPESARPLLIVGERDRPVDAEVFEELGKLLDRLPEAAAQGFGLLVHGLLEPATERIARFVARMHELDWLGPEQPVGAVPGVAPVAYGIGPAARPEAVPQAAPVAAPRPAAVTASAPAAAAIAGPATQATPAALTAAPEEPVAEPAAEPEAEPEVEVAAPLPDPTPRPVPAAVGPPIRTSTSGGPDEPAAGPRRPVAPATYGSTPAVPSCTAAAATEGGHRPEPATEPATEPTAPPPVPAPEADPTPAPDEEPTEAPPAAPVTTPVPAPVPAPDEDPAPDGEDPAPDGEDPAPDGDDPDPTPTPVPPPAAPQTRLLTPEASPATGTAAPVSSPHDRDAVRTLLGEHYQRCSGRVDQVATRLPGLRSTAKDDIKPDLAAVLLHHGDTGVPVPRAELVAAARSGDPTLAPFLRCLGSGLRRLPSHHGAVLLCAPPGLDPEALLAHYRAGQRLTEPAPVTGLSAPAVELPGSTVEFFIWSATGRRTAAFGSGTEPQVTFTPGTTFTVLATTPSDRTDPAGRPARVLLRESGPADADPADRDRSALSRLTVWLDRRDQLSPADRRHVEDTVPFHLTPGVEVLPAAS
ncbi:hypothetical protein [Streptomyces sp. 1331.2]|uniref:hypothetical protein n=1 Tax=Streptomyces sp. 1331.2 TaxID=1938835 RepID=UPI000BD5432C|nr:hypothetical protein [Streptomyces sp. 1331.2]SOB82728.1 hypothetical protein SAMN06272789_2903 [Streptomyces sp. 1331.2]